VQSFSPALQRAPDLTGLVKGQPDLLIRVGQDSIQANQELFFQVRGQPQPGIRRFFDLTLPGQKHGQR
jgi:hypothetical protein